jgi:DNA-binding MarR family transcriptional regulator
MTSDEGFQDYAIGFLLREAHERAAAAFATALEPLGIAGRHFAVLHILDRRGPLSQRELVDSTGSHKASMVRIVDDLETERLAARRPIQGDRRVWSVEITDHGRETLNEAEHTARLVTAQLLSHLNQDKRELLTALLTEFVRGA